MSLRGKTVLVVGSSSVGSGGGGSLGIALEELLRARGANPVFDARGGRGLAGDADNRLAGTLEQRGKFLQLLHEVRPHLVLVAIGGNPSGTDVQVREAMVFVRDAVARQGAELVWFGPPVYWDRYPAATTAQLDAVGPGVLGDRYHSSVPYTDVSWGRLADRVHFTPEGARSWATPMVAELERASRPSLWAVAGVLGAVAGAGVIAARAWR